jgi:quinol monooxygenase YgiN
MRFVSKRWACPAYGSGFINHAQDNQMKKGKVRSTIRMLIPLDKQSEALDILGSVSAQIQFEPSCISSRIYRGVDEVRAIMVEELWANDEDIKRHLNSDVYRRVLLVIEMAEESPEIRFDIIAGTSGVETIEMARNQSEANHKISRHR